MTELNITLLMFLCSHSLFCHLANKCTISHRSYVIIIIIIIINEKINVAFSRRTARTRNSHKKHKPLYDSMFTNLRLVSIIT